MNASSKEAFWGSLWTGVLRREEEQEVHDMEGLVSLWFRWVYMAVGRIRMVPAVLVSHLILNIIQLITDLR